MPVLETAILQTEQHSEILAVAAECERFDGVYPLSEQAVLGLAMAGPCHLVAVPAGSRDVCGYAQYDPSTLSAELFVLPAMRRRHIGAELLVRLRAASGLEMTDAPHPTLRQGGPRMWAHGDLPPAQAFARSRGLVKIRELWRMSRGLEGPLPSAPLPAGVRLAAFRPGADDGAWLALNAEVFASHPEQGRWTEVDLAARLAEPWFDPKLFLLAWRGDQLVGFSWLKTAKGEGEIYVIGVASSGRGAGLGKAMTGASLAALEARGCEAAQLYVDADNVSAVQLYRWAGFELAGVDAQYRYPA